MCGMCMQCGICVGYWCYIRRLCVEYVWKVRLCVGFGVD